MELVTWNRLNLGCTSTLDDSSRLSENSLPGPQCINVTPYFVGCIEGVNRRDSRLRICQGFAKIRNAIPVNLESGSDNKSIVRNLGSALGTNLVSFRRKRLDVFGFQSDMRGNKVCQPSPKSVFVLKSSANKGPGRVLRSRKAIVVWSNSPAGLVVVELGTIDYCYIAFSESFPFGLEFIVYLQTNQL